MSVLLTALLAFALAQASASVRADTVSLIPTNSVWKYLDSGADPGVAWRAPAFNDSGWASGPGPLGCGEMWLNTVLNIGSGTNRLLTAYFRRSFVVTNAGAVTGLTTRLLRDDGAVVYLNDTEVLRHNMPPGPVNYWTLATTVVGGTDETTYFSNALLPSLLVNGTNLVAVEVHQNSAASADLTFDLEVLASTASTNNPASAVLNEVLAHNQSVTNSGGTVTDWVELHNPAEQPVDLADCSLSDSPTTPRRWVFPLGAIVPAHGFLLVRCDAGAPPSTNSHGALNIGFELPANGGALYFFDRPANGGALLDALTFGLQAADLSLGRAPDASGAWTLCQPTPAAVNAIAAVGNPAALKVNEWMAAPAAGEDWFELFNPQLQPVALGGLHLSDDLTQRTKHPIPALSYIGGGVRGYAVFWADGTPAAGADHVNFRLNNSGEALGVSTSSGDLIDAVTVGAQQMDVSEGRLPDGATNIVRFPLSATPGAANGPPPVEPPVITLPPASLTLSAGQPATFTVQATGTPPLTFQWLFDGNPLAGATNATLTLSNAQPRHWGEYHVAASNAAGSVMSSGAQLRLWPLFGWGAPVWAPSRGFRLA